MKNVRLKFLSLFVYWTFGPSLNLRDLQLPTESEDMLCY